MTLRVMVVDDTVTYRSIMSKVVLSFSQLELVATATNGQVALDKIATNPVDLVFLDVEMPVMDGLATLKVLKEKYPQICVVFVSATNSSSADTTIKALQLGALDFITKPDEGSLSNNFNELHKRIERVIKAIPASKPSPLLVTTRNNSSTLAYKTQPLPKKKINPVDVVVIGVSTGGPNALTEIIPQLDASLNVPVFLVQHMPPIFTGSLAVNLDRKSKVTVKEAVDGELVQSGFVYIAPGGKHLTVLKKDGQVLVGILVVSHL
jgi:two-component system, chemotaxis family, protein-glutamate methylesterase/glutaminase